MISAFYRRHSGKLIAFVLLTFPFAAWLAETIPCNNDIETWLPEKSDARTAYEHFRSTFGADECIAVGYKRDSLSEVHSEALCRRLERIEGVKHCWSPARLGSLMSELDVSAEDSRERLNHLVQSPNGEFHAMLVVLNNWGVANRSTVVDGVRDQIQYSGISDDSVALAGSPIVVTELDRLGNRDNNKIFFIVTLAVCLALLQCSVRNWPLSFSIVGLTVWAIDVTMAVLHLSGSEMNFILSALPVLVMVFTLAVSIHFLHNYKDCYQSEDPLTEAFLAMWKPAALATITTVIGLASLAVSSIGPVRQFGLSASVGSVVALIAGLGVLPAVLLKLGYAPTAPTQRQLSTYRSAWALVTHARYITVGVTALVLVCGIGLPWLSSKIDPVEFLPDDSRALADVRTIEKNLTGYDSVEVIVDFGVTDVAFFDRLSEVQRIQGIVASHPAIGHTMSMVSFLPSEALNGSMPPASLIAKARSRHDDGTFVADASRMWRISARLAPNSQNKAAEVVASIKAMTAGKPVTVTGLRSVLDTAQADIFAGFWESFATAFLLISAIMLLALRSVKAGLLAMIPNLTPICIVFGILGWVGIPVDIGTMMTASIALGLAVDGTFHFLFAHHRIVSEAEVKDPLRCTHLALCRTGLPILQAAVISAIGMLALTLSNFKPTVKFGYLMCALLLTALLGDLILLPAILALKRRRSTTSEPAMKGPHFDAKTKRPAIHA